MGRFCYTCLLLVYRPPPHRAVPVSHKSPEIVTSAFRHSMCLLVRLRAWGPGCGLGGRAPSPLNGGLSMSRLTTIGAHVFRRRLPRRVPVFPEIRGCRLLARMGDSVFEVVSGGFSEIGRGAAHTAAARTRAPFSLERSGVQLVAPMLLKVLSRPPPRTHRVAANRACPTFCLAPCLGLGLSNGLARDIVLATVHGDRFARGPARPRHPRTSVGKHSPKLSHRPGPCPTFCPAGASLPNFAPPAP